MKIKISKISGHFFQCFSEVTYNVHSGMLFGNSCSGKTTLLKTIPACFINAGLDGKKLSPLSPDANAGWVKIEYTADGEYHEVYRAWDRTSTGFHSSSSLCKTPVKSLFLAIANPLYVPSLENADRVEFLVDYLYHNSTDELVNVLPDDVSREVYEFADEFGKVDASKLRNVAKMLKTNIKDLSGRRFTLDAQVVILENMNIEHKEISDELDSVIDEIETKTATLRIIETINGYLLSNAIKAINEDLHDAKFSEDGKLFYGETPIDQRASSEKLDCGLDISNATAGRYEFVPPTLIDNATAFGHKEVDISTYPNLSQIITASFAEVDLCEYGCDNLHALDRSWKRSIEQTFRPEVVIEMIPII